MMDATHILHWALALAGFISIVCRLKGMSRATKLHVRVQHVLLLAGVVWSVVLPDRFAVLAVLGGVVVFLLLSAVRWRDGPPPGTTKPMDLDEISLHHAAGGTRSES